MEVPISYLMKKVLADKEAREKFFQQIMDENYFDTITDKNKIFYIVYKKLFKKKTLEIKHKSKPKNITYNDFVKAIDKLIILGFAKKTRFLNGEEMVDITSRGKDYYKI